MELQYSEEFIQKVKHLLRGKELWPNYAEYIKYHIGNIGNGVDLASNFLCPEIEYHCGNLKDKTILDFGCGTGSTTTALAKSSSNIYAYDIDIESIEICRQRLKEHHLEKNVKEIICEDFDDFVKSSPCFDIILLNGVVEHIPLSKKGLRKRILCSLFDKLNQDGFLYINDTPNRLYPFDAHSTQLWWIPWMKAGSKKAFNKAVKYKRHSESPTHSEGTLGLEEIGAWGSTYFEIKNILKEKNFKFINNLSGHNRHIYYSYKTGWKQKLFDFVLYYSFVKIFNIPLTTFYPNIANLVIKKT